MIRKKKHQKQDKGSSSNVSKKVRLKIIGVGGAGGNVVTRLYDKRIEGIDLISINTDLQGLKHTKADVKIQIGKNTCRGLGAGMDPSKAEKRLKKTLKKLIKQCKAEI